ncbi:MAG: tRNA 4-thiouridine(8) synthase ThiI [Acidobacteria bacterium]|nr:tRNA 4-thiouridine(8) synthase ThiI [Acidobacteriota bacterium]
MTDHLIIIAPDEISIKGKNRSQFERRLAENIARALNITPSRVQRERGRLYVQMDSESEPWIRRLERVFGVRNFSHALRIPPTIEAMEAGAIECAREKVARGARTFKVETRREMKAFPMNSMEINAHLGRLLLQAIPDLKVDVHEPDFRLHVEVRRVGILLSTRSYPGPGGLPVGINGRALLLLSGGIDSPVAGWMVMKRGLSLDAVYFHSPPYTGEKAKEKAFELARVLSRWKLAPVKIYVLSLTEIQEQTAQMVPSPLWTVIHRRFMHRLAERIARLHGYHTLVTGESVGQVASQTVQNMECIDRSVRILVLRPLTGFDKLEIVAKAKQIGTFEISILPYEDCCTLFAPKNPTTKARLEQVEAAESKLDVEGLTTQALERIEVASASEQ